MAANLKKPPAEAGKKDEKAPKAERERFTPDWKWVFIGLGFVVAMFSATVVGVHVYATHFLVKERVHTKLVLKMPTKPGPSVPLFTSQISNLRGGRYLRYSVVLQYAANEHLWPSGGGGSAGASSAKQVNPLEKYEPLMKDVVVSAISRHTAAELLEPTGREMLKNEIMHDVNAQIQKVFGGPSAAGGDHHGPGDGAEGGDSHLPQVLRVFFTEFVVS